ncbi:MULTISPECIES: zinc-ribbon domain-containing protein [Flavobacteriaceae]|uniref:zinc-ribbon domain-containing protein n=1 Tax=Flavobacteriaceae TaxID=49546 RepID=UPI00149130D5|nr:MULTISPECIES: zinc-ribbon domain-containing protein [Allomuricauda]MDC6365202.1 zinc-ribbon domain-containing protein [Muricauda sp. AC10]
MKILGSRSNYIGALKLNDVKCNFCEKKETQNIIEFGSCFHIFLVPMFPLGRETFMECEHCKRKIKKSEFNYELKKIYYENGLKLRRPWWHWAGFILILLVFIFYNTWKLIDR